MPRASCRTIMCGLLLLIPFSGACERVAEPTSTQSPSTTSRTQEALISIDTIPDEALRVGVRCDPEACECRFTYLQSSGAWVRSEALVVPVGQRVALDFSKQGGLDSLYLEGFEQTLRPTSKQAFVLPMVKETSAEHSALLAELSCTTSTGASRRDEVVHHVVVAPAEAVTHFIQTGDLLVLYESAQAKGRALFVHRGCAQCHAVDGSALVGPPLNGLLGRSLNLKTAEGDTRTRTADEAYIIESMLNPKALVSPGYANNMPSYAGKLTPDEVTLIVGYLKGLP